LQLADFLHDQALELDDISCTGTGKVAAAGHRSSVVQT
jgi:hypothetical protein